MARDKISIAERTGLVMFFVGTTQAVIPFPVHEISSHDALLALPGLIRDQRAVAIRTEELTWTNKVRELLRILDVMGVTPSDVQYLDSDEMSSMATASFDVMPIEEFERIRKYAGGEPKPEYGVVIRPNDALEDGDLVMEDGDI